MGAAAKAREANNSGNAVEELVQGIGHVAWWGLSPSLDLTENPVCARLLLDRFAVLETQFWLLYHSRRWLRLFRTMRSYRKKWQRAADSFGTCTDVAHSFVQSVVLCGATGRRGYTARAVCSRNRSTIG